MGTCDKQSCEGPKKYTCIMYKGRPLPFTVQPYPELLEALNGMKEWEYKKAVGRMLKDKVLRIVY